MKEKKRPATFIENNSLATLYIKQNPFPTPAHETALRGLARVNNLVPRFIDREAFSGRKSKVQPKQDGRSILFLPQDPHFKDLPAITHSLQDTSSQKKSEKGNNNGVSVAIYLAKATEGLGGKAQVIARATVEEIYQYGEQLEGRDFGKVASKELATQELSEEQMAQFDEAFGIVKLHKASPSKGDLEAVRRSVFTQFFTVAARQNAASQAGVARALEKYVKPIMQASQTAFEAAILAHGDMHLRSFGKRGWSEKIQERFTENSDIAFSSEKQTVKDVLNFPSLVAGLDEARATGDIVTISAKEKEIAEKIQQVISSLPYSTKNNGLPTMSVKRQDINCLIATRLGGDLLKEAGIRYVVASQPAHSLTFLVTSDGKVYWHDFLNPHANSEQLSQDATSRQQVIDLSEGELNKIVRLCTGERNKGEYIHFYPPGVGETLQTLINTGGYLANQKKYHAAITARERALAIDPDLPEQQGALGLLYMLVGRYQEAFAAFKKGNTLAPQSNLLAKTVVSMLRNLQKDPQKIAAWRELLKKEGGYKELYSGASGAYYMLSLERETNNSGKKEKTRKAKQALRNTIFLNEEMLVMNPDDLEVADNLVEDLMEAGREERAKEVLDHMITISQKKITPGSTDINAYKKLSRLFRRAGRIEEKEVIEDKIIAIYREKIAQAPDDIDLYRDLAIRLYNRPDEAISVRQKIIEFANADASDYYYLARDLAESGRVQEALVIYRQIIETEAFKEDKFFYSNAKEAIVHLSENSTEEEGV